jgi:large subunit ribosomal protein L29
MKGVQAKDLRGNEPAELERTLAKLRNDLFQARLKRPTNQLENTMLIRNTRRDIAKIHTVLAEAKKAAPAKAAQPEKEK